MNARKIRPSLGIPDLVPMALDRLSQGEASVLEISDAIDRNPNRALQVLETLVEEGRVEEVGPRMGTRGKPQRVFRMKRSTRGRKGRIEVPPQPNSPVVAVLRRDPLEDAALGGSVVQLARVLKDFSRGLNRVTFRVSSGSSQRSGSSS